MNTNRNRMLKTAFFLKKQLTAVKGKREIDTQQIRRELIGDLLFLQEYASRKSKDRRFSRKNRIKWMQIATQISRTINYIAKDFDSIQIKEKLEELQKIVDNEFHEESKFRVSP